MIALWILLFFVVPTVRGRHAQHNIARVVRPEGPINPDGSTTVFVDVQERGEYRLGKLLGILAALPFFSFDITFAGSLLQLLVMAAVDGSTRLMPFVDYAGHEAEIMAAEAAGIRTYRQEEIARMSDDRDKIGDNIPAQLARWRWLARVVYYLGRW